MNLFLRLLYRLVASPLGPRLGVLDVGRVTMRVWPGDLDILWHMNNGRYLTIMDLGRVDFLIRAGLLAKLRQRKWFPVVAALTITYKRPLRLWQRFEMTTRVAGWDDRWIYLSQEFHSGGKLVASALIKGTFRSAAGAVPMAAVVELSGFEGPSPQIPPAAALLDADVSA
jgi:acyl-CoA thioesterase FadM